MFLATVALALALVASTGAFSAASADRGISVAVADDDRAYLGVQLDDTGNESVEVTLTNRFDSDLSSVTISTDTDTASLSLDSRDTGSVIVGIDCGDSKTVTIDGLGESASVSLERHASVGCSSNESSTNTTASTDLAGSSDDVDSTNDDDNEGTEDEGDEQRGESDDAEDNEADDADTTETDGGTGTEAETETEDGATEDDTAEDDDSGGER
ncbi:hypothetical protein BRC86_10865 [Halobacteriales archaeon QS_3_64_16]|nr:MAG: hypothetical protein BRC86_10865 [Halobacteriales archaeon QS_3_64_16]